MVADAAVASEQDVQILKEAFENEIVELEREAESHQYQPSNV